MEISLGLTIAPASILVRLNIVKLVPKDVSSLFYAYFRHHKVEEGDIMVRILTDPTHCVSGTLLEELKVIMSCPLRFKDEIFTASTRCNSSSHNYRFCLNCFRYCII